MTSGLGSLLVALTYAAGAAVAVTAAIEDYRVRRLRNSYTATLAILALVGFGFAALAGDEPFPLLDMALGGALFSGPWLIVHLISPAALGFGDVKLTAALGLYLGWLDPRIALQAIIVATVGFGLVLVVTRSGFAESKPFGPALVLGAAVAVAFAWTTC